MLDCGVTSYNKIKDFMDDVKIIYITHEHQDHARKSVIEKASKLHPHILFVAGEHLKPLFETLEVKHKILKEDVVYDFGIAKLRMVKLYHDVINYGVYIEDDLKGLYMTDTAHVEGIEFNDLDWLIIESNYNEEKHTELANNSSNPFRYTNAFNSHLSDKQAQDFIKKSCKLGCEVLLCHLSSSYNEVEYLNHYIYAGKEVL